MAARNKKNRVFLINPGGVRKLSQEELEQYAGVGLNPPKKKRKKSASKKKRSSSSNLGGSSMAKRKRKSTTSRKKTRRTKKRKVSANRKRKATRRKPASRKATKSRKRKVSANRKRKTRRKKRKVRANRKRTRSTRRKPRRKVSANRKRTTRKKPRRRRSTRRNAIAALPTLRSRPRRKPLRRRARRNSMWPVAANPILANPLGRKSASNLAWRQRKRKRKGYAAAKQIGGRYPVARNPRNPLQAFKANLAGVINKRMLIDAAQMTVGSVGAPVLAVMLAKTFAKATGRPLPIAGPVGYVFTAASGAVLATGVAMVSKDANLPKNVLLGTIGGIFADIAKKTIVPMILGGGTPLAPAAAVTAPETAQAGVSGLRGPRQDLARELALSGLGAYATGEQIIRAGIEEQF